MMDYAHRVEFALFRSWCLILYGSASSPQGDEEINQFSSSALPSFNNNTIYKIKSQNYNNNRKQLQQLQKATTISTQSSSIRKNGGGKQKNKNGKNSQRMSSTTTTTTSRPFTHTTVMLNPFSISGAQQIVKSKNGGKFNQTKSSTTTTTIARARPTAKLPSMKNNGGNNNLNSASKLDQKYSNIYEKSSGKAPKQVKEDSYTAKPSPSLSTVNPSILRMFERYEKIEEIFPELEPQKENHNPVYFTVSNGKREPSRENSKSFSNFVSLDSTTPQKKNTPNDRLEARQRDSSGKGTICSNHSVHSSLFFSLDFFLYSYQSLFCFLRFN